MWLFGFWVDGRFFGLWVVICVGFFGFLVVCGGMDLLFIVVGVVVVLRCCFVCVFF